MTDLEKLIEKKDLLIYIDERSTMLADAMQAAIHSEDRKDREVIRQKFRGRIRELRELKSVISQGKLKDKCKEYMKKNRDGE